MKTIIKISAWILILFGLLTLVISLILIIAGVIRSVNPGGAARLLQSRIPTFISLLFQGLLLVGIGEILYLLLSANKNLLSDPISNNAKTDSSIKKKNNPLKNMKKYTVVLLIITVLFISLACRWSSSPLANLSSTANNSDVSQVDINTDIPIGDLSEMVTNLNIRYQTLQGVNPDLTSLDIYAPQNAKELTVLVFVHGGAWSMGDKATSVGEKPGAFVRAGYLFVSINYRLSPAVIHPAHVQDTASALAWIHAHINEYGGDPQKIYIMGHSAGAHLVALVATDETYLQAVGESLSLIKGVIGLDGGGYDIPLNLNSADALTRRVYQQAFGTDPQTWKNASAYYHIQCGKSIPPFLLIHAGQRDVSRIESYELADALHACEIRAELFHATDKNHGSLNTDLGKPGDASTKAILAFLSTLK